MDDKRLQTEFDEYFKGAQLPENITADAKAQVKQRKGQSLKWFFRLAPVAAAFAIIIAVTIVFYGRFNAPADGPEGAEPPAYSYYSASSLTAENINPYESAPQGLEFIGNLIEKRNSSVEVCAYYSDGELTLAQADVSLLQGGYRYDATIFVEYTDEYCCYEELQDYLSGETINRAGRSYILNTDYDEGEKVYKVYFKNGNIKYYLYVMTAAENGYLKILDIL